MPFKVFQGIRWKESIARACLLVFFVLATITLLFRQKMEPFFSRWALDWLIWMMGCYFVVAIMSIATLPKYILKISLISVGTIILLIFAEYSNQNLLRDVLIVVGMILSIIVRYSAHKYRLRTRSERSSWRYLIFGSASFLGISAAILSVALISSFSTTRIDCDLLRDNLRRSGIEDKLTQTSLGDILGSMGSKSGLLPMPDIKSLEGEEFSTQTNRQDLSGLTGSQNKNSQLLEEGGSSLQISLDSIIGSIGGIKGNNQSLGEESLNLQSVLGLLGSSNGAMQLSGEGGSSLQTSLESILGSIGGIKGNNPLLGEEEGTSQGGFQSILGLLGSPNGTIQLSGEAQELSGQDSIVQTILSLKNRIFDQVITQQGVLQQDICTLVIKQIDRLQTTSRRQIAGSLLLYMLLRPMLDIILRLALPIFLLLRKLLSLIGFFKTRRVQKMVLEMSIEDDHAVAPIPAEEVTPQKDGT